MKMLNMHKSISLIAATALTAAMAVTAAAQTPMVKQRTTAISAKACGLPVSDILLRRDGGLMTVGMTMQLAGFDMHGDRATVFTPLLVNGTDTLAFDPVGLYSRIRYIQYLREGERPAGGDKETSYRYAGRPETETYAQTVPYSEWMNGAVLWMQRSDYGCCNSLIDEDLAPLAEWREIAWRPAFHYIMPVAEPVKMRELSGRAYIDFPVNRTELYPDYRKNPVELAKIIDTIDSVRNDSDVTVRRITIKGWASPESSWANNTRLAIGRTATLKQYVQNLYHFPEGFIETDYYPEDWIGLRAFVETSNLPHRQEILDLIDDPTIEPDPKEDKMKKTWPDEYKFLLATVYPGLRHSDYTIEYTIRQFNDPVEIRRILAEAPQKLSLNEMFVLAQTLEPGSDEFNEVFETAVRMYPRDETANLNAASSAMQRGDLANAERYLAKAGDSDEATYARAIYAILTDDTARGVELFETVADRLPEAAEALETIRDIHTTIE